MDKTIFRHGEHLSVGPMVLVSPEVAVRGPENSVILQAMAFSNWPGPVFALRASDWPDNLEPYQRDYVDAFRAAEADGGIYSIRCGGGLADLTGGARMMMRHIEFRRAVARGAISVTGGWLELQVARVDAVLRSAGLVACLSMSTVRRDSAVAAGQVVSEI